MNPDLIVIGGGSAGIEAALTGARLGAETILIHQGSLGGRATHGSLLPSKVWLHEAYAGRDVSEILARIKTVQEYWIAAQREMLASAGVEIIQQRARITANQEVELLGDERKLCARAIILASGSEPRFPPSLKPDAKRVIAPRLLTRLDWLPKRVVVIGGGPTGTEMAYLFNVLGADVIWIPGKTGILPDFPTTAVSRLEKILMERGVRVVPAVNAPDIKRAEDQATVITDEGSRYAADLVFVAIGRAPDLNNQGLESLNLGADVKPDNYGLVRSGLYLVGDVAGKPFLANRAQAMAHIAVRHALGFPAAPLNLDTLVHAVYSQPEIAWVGDLRAGKLHSIELPLKLVLKAQLDDPAGSFCLYWDEQQRIRGGWILGQNTADALAPLSTAIAAGLVLGDLARSWPANPTLGEILPMAARAALDRAHARPRDDRKS